MTCFPAHGGLPNSAAHLEKSDRNEGARRRRPLVLVVDDEEMVAESIAEILRDEGFETIVALSGSDAVEVARGSRPDLVLTDVLMPEMDGVQTAIAIRAMYNDARILLFSGQAGTSDIVAEAESQGHTFELLPKPLHPAKLLAAIHKLM